jgi:hypothetical protein
MPEKCGVKDNNDLLNRWIMDDDTCKCKPRNKGKECHKEFEREFMRTLKPFSDDKNVEEYKEECPKFVFDYSDSGLNWVNPAIKKSYVELCAKGKN